MKANMTPKISVIIPVYNVEKYIDRCLTTVREQTFEDIEIICVDDCSPDNSSSIIKRHAAVDPRITLIQHESNLGLGGARNTAIKVAKADYIASVDSDDYVVPEMLQTLWDATNNGQFDIICCSFNRVDEEGNILSHETYPSKIITNENNSINIFSTLNLAFWNKLWRKSLFTENEIFFPMKDYFEDLPTTPRILAKAKHIKIINDRLYNYFVRPGSITNSYSPKHMIDYFKGYEILLNFLEKNNLIDRYKDEFINFINASLRFHSESVVGSGMNEIELEQYFRLFLMLKVAFIENRDKFKSKNLEELLELIKNRELVDYNNVRRSHVLNDITKYKNAISILENENNKSLEDILKFQNKLVNKSQESNELSISVSKYRNLLEVSRNELSHQNKVLLKHQKLLDASSKRNSDMEAEIQKSQKLLDASSKKNSDMEVEIQKSKKSLEISNLENSKQLLDIFNYKNKIKIFNEEKKNALNCLQKLGTVIYGVLIRVFMTQRHALKLKENPRLFFKDSKNIFTRMIGRFLKLI